ncbi:hypothetical protein LTR86_008987 [Recurvomyces mirabilis]|nr:hypothetical protein LTR86_008987 [Recurvomyces mirabilis]
MLDEWLSGRGESRAPRLITVTLDLGHATFTEPTDQWENFTDLWQAFQRHAHRYSLSGLDNIHFQFAVRCRLSLVGSKDRGVTIHYEAPITIGVVRGRRLWFSRAYGVLDRLRRDEGYDDVDDAWFDSRVLNRCTQAFHADIGLKHSIELWFKRVAEILFSEQQQDG